MQDKVNLYYEGQQGRLALRCCMRLVWGDVNFVITAQRYSDSPQEAQVALLETLGQRYINISKEAERHQQRALELEAQLGDALRSAEVARDENQEFKDVLLEKDERVLDLERQLLNLGPEDRVKELERQLASAIAAGQVEREAKDRVRRELAEQIETTRLLRIELTTLRARNAELERLPARNERLEEDIAVMRRDQELLTQQLEKVVTLAKVVIDSSKREE